MTEQVTPESEISAELPFGKFRARGADLISILLAAWLGVLTYGLYTHMVEAREAAETLRKVNEEVAKTLMATNRDVAAAMQAGVKAQRFTACLVATKDAEREKQYLQPNSFCNRMSQ